MKLFVTNLPRQCSEEELIEHFSSCGTPTSAKIILDRETGRSRGFGFVEMSNSEEGQRAIQELNDKELGGRPLVVKEAVEQERRERRPAPRRDNRGGGGRGGNR